MRTRDAASRPLETTIRPSLPVDLGRTLWPLRHGRGDPRIAVERSGAWWRATRTPLGPAATRVERLDGQIRVTAWGPGAAWAVETAPEVLGCRDSLDGFDPPPGLIRDLHRHHPGLRITRSRAVFESLLPTILEQKVISSTARAAYRGIVRAWGEAAPGPYPLLLPPDPRVIARTPYFEFHRFGVEMKRANIARGAASRARRVEETLSMIPAEARRTLQAIPGVGPWTSAKVAMVAHGDADAVPVGDYHIPHTVAWALAGEARGTDARMLELLEPYRGHRGRVIRLLVGAGIGAPRFGPKMPIRSFERT